MTGLEAAGDTTKTAVFFTGAGFLVVLILIGVAAILLALSLLRRSRR